jgi:2-dehydropantoate 2-reductase
MGSLFGSQLAEGGLGVTLIDIWREHVDAINNDGLRIVGHRGEHRVNVTATADAASCGAADVVLVQCKAASTTAAVRNALDAGLFHDDSVAISFQNGLGNEEMIADVLGAERVLGGVTAQGASIEGPGCIRSYADLPSQIGKMEGGVSERATAIAHAFSEHGLETVPSPYIRHDIWKKLMVNVGVSAMSGIANLTIGAAIAIPWLRRMCYGAVAEAVPVAQADGVPMSPEESREVLDMVTGPGGTGGNKSSLCVDILNRRPTEIDVINGAVVARGERYGIETPINAALVALVKGLESHYLTR